ncbi:NAD-dependent epimerase/dehydratase family protein [Carnobacterium sp. PL12RED10]|uniref:NAD-dependent epimerase/dehydratase family protein n=1 Tax=Carnobacterium sp. PL12RED10 TaxID=2592351 RepID=UPI0011EDBF89|nr:NAD-dependent epimerase/dehydratase family protein [Carnobacterium sp. PL12RED10]KAF3302245.1 NAD-dependent epimerase/dehydratase family protein [Carnobacterium sp. PL12RED10]
MKKILITGQNSYIGNKFEEWVSQWPDEYRVTKISVRNDDWKNQNWNVFDVVLNVAGIAHQRITKENENDYYRVNRDLAIDIANKAKNEGVGHFIQTSTMSVFGLSSGKIDLNTSLNPKNAYGKSKLEADEYIKKMQSLSFNVSIIRPPMVYGYKSPGNYKLLSKFAKITPIFPRITNFRSMIYIGNLVEFLKIVVDNNLSGFQYPQNSEYVSTIMLIKLISGINEHKVLFIKLPSVLEYLISKFKVSEKIFGNLTYDKKMSKLGLGYNVVNFKKSVAESEKE